MALNTAVRVGQGIDVHPFKAGRKLILGTVDIPCHVGLEGHSDADALLHAIVDALLGAMGKGDIGQYFPNTDPRWKDCSSTHFLQSVWQEVKAQGWAIANLDCCVLAQVPKLAPHIPKMKAGIAEILGLDIAQIGIKATTTEKLGFVGRSEGLLASCVALLVKEEGRSHE